MPSNSAAYLTAQGAPLEVKEAPYPTPGDGEIIVQNKAIAINPVDYATQMMGQAIFPWLQYPAINGYDVAGEVVEVGSNVSNFKVGDRVVAYSAVAFQTYSTVLAHTAAHIPASTTYEQASVIPLGLLTAVSGLFGKEYLALEYPTTNPKPTGKTVLITGGATSVGCNAIQLAVAAGYEVISTSSPKNFDLVKKLGASKVFDYNSPTVWEDVLASFKGKESAGALAITAPGPPGPNPTLTACFDIVSKVDGTKFVALTMVPPKEMPEGIGAKFCMPAFVTKDLELSKAIFADYLTPALAEGKFTPAPEAKVVGTGLEAIQGALDKLKKEGVSAAKIVVTL